MSTPFRDPDPNFAPASTNLTTQNFPAVLPASNPAPAKLGFFNHLIHKHVDKKNKIQYIKALLPQSDTRGIEDFFANFDNIVFFSDHFNPYKVYNNHPHLHSLLTQPRVLAAFDKTYVQRLFSHCLENQTHLIDSFFDAGIEPCRGCDDFGHTPLYNLVSRRDLVGVTIMLKRVHEAYDKKDPLAVEDIRRSTNEAYHQHRSSGLTATAEIIKALNEAQAIIDAKVQRVVDGIKNKPEDTKSEPPSPLHLAVMNSPTTCSNQLGNNGAPPSEIGELKTLIQTLQTQVERSSSVISDLSEQLKHAKQLISDFEQRNATLQNTETNQPGDTIRDKLQHQRLGASPDDHRPKPTLPVAKS